MIVLDTQVWFWWAQDEPRLPAICDRLARDPADRIVVATAIALGVELATTDGKIRQYPHVRTVQFRDR